MDVAIFTLILILVIGYAIYALVKRWSVKVQADRLPQCSVQQTSCSTKTKNALHKKLFNNALEKSAIFQRMIRVRFQRMRLRKESEKKIKKTKADIYVSAFTFVHRCISIILTKTIRPKV